MRQTGERQFYAVLIWEGSTNEGVLETLNKVVFGWHEIRRKRGGRTSTPSSSTCVGGRCHAEDGTLLLTSAGSAAALRVFWVGGGRPHQHSAPSAFGYRAESTFQHMQRLELKTGRFDSGESGKNRLLHATIYGDYSSQGAPTFKIFPSSQTFQTTCCSSAHS